jgi:hypothetical protein
MILLIVLINEFLKKKVLKILSKGKKIKIK